MMLALAVAAAVDYQQAATWLCRPGRQDACAVDLSVTVVDADGRMRAEPPSRSPAPRADCFYVYPTVSLDPTPNSDLQPGDEERGMVAAQFAPFAGVCRLYAPLYRQVTLTALRAMLGGSGAKPDFELAYADVRAAWHDYLARDNHGRPFVLIGHSQGSLLLKRLVADEIDGTPLQRQMLSAILPGTAVQVPVGKDVGGDFKAVPLCRSAAQTGCVLTWASYRDTAPPPADALFGRPGGPELVAGCTNPAAPAGGSAPFDAVLGFPWWRGGVAQYRRPADWTAPTRFVRLPGLVSGECVVRGGFSYLAVHVADEAHGGVAAATTAPAAIGDDAWPGWGFHVVDVAIVQGDLVRLVARQTAAWHATRPRR